MPFTDGYPRQHEYVLADIFDGELGVRIFFVLSGFLITHLLLKEANTTGAISLKGFYIRRALRILPIYVTYLLVLGLLTAGGLYHDAASSWIGALTFTRNMIGQGRSATGQLWSLAVEEQFYLLWPITLGAFSLWRRPRAFVSVLLLAIVACPIVRATLMSATPDGSILSRIWRAPANAGPARPIPAPASSRRRPRSSAPGAATTVDTVALRARVNKAMIYYHFKDKRALYASILRSIWTTIGGHLQAIAALPLPPPAGLDRLIDTLVQALGEERLFLPIILRELAGGGAHLGAEAVGLIAAIFATVSGVIAEGVRTKTFQPVHPGLAHFSLIGPLVMFRASAPVRARVQELTGARIPDADSATIARHLQMVARRMLAPATTEEHRAEKLPHRHG